MATFADHIDDYIARKGETIQACVIGSAGWGRNDAIEELEPLIEPVQGKVITWDEARPLLDYTYDSGYGAPTCHAVYLWTESYIVWVTQYDGATWLDSAPRNPVECYPHMPGG